MKNKLLLFITPVIMMSCWDNIKSKSQQQEEEAAADSVVLTEKLTFTNTDFKKKKKITDGELPSYEINISVKYAKGSSSAAQEINRQLAAFLFNRTTTSVEKAKEEFADSLSGEYEKELREFYDPDNEYQDTYQYEYTQTGRLADNAPDDVAAYINRVDMYTGGAHGGAMESYINLQKSTGKAITCRELFGKNQDAVRKLIKANIIRENDCKTEDELTEKRGIFSLGDVYISDNNFLLEKDSILFCYNPYDIAPWSEGFIFTRLSYQDLNGLILMKFNK